MAQPGSMASQSRISFAAGGTAIASYTEAHECISESLKLKGQISDDEGIRGTRSHASERTAAGTDEVGGTIVMDCYPAMLNFLLPRILGAAASGTTFALADTLPEFDVLIDRVAKRFVYAGCKVNKATFTSSPNKRLQVSLDIRGKSETVASTAFPAIAIPTDAPYMHSMGVFTLVSSARNVLDFKCVVDNMLNVRYTNSQQATDISPKDRIISVDLKVPFTSDETDLYAQALLGSAATVVYTNGSNSCTFTFGKIQFPPESPTIPGKTEIILPLSGIARKTGSTAELVVTNV